MPHSSMPVPGFQVDEKSAPTAEGAQSPRGNDSRPANPQIFAAFVPGMSDQGIVSIESGESYQRMKAQLAHLPRPILLQVFPPGGRSFFYRETWRYPKSSVFKKRMH